MTKTEDGNEWENETVSEYWYKHYADGFCTLCGNSGVIDTRKSVGVFKGRVLGRLNYCICPNGQAKRARPAQSDLQGPAWLS